MENGNGPEQPKGGTNHHGRPVQRYVRVAMGSWNTPPPFCAKPAPLLTAASEKHPPTAHPTSSLGETDTVIASERQVVR